MSEKGTKNNSNAVFALKYRLVLTTRGEASILKKAMRQEMDRVIRPILFARSCSVVEFDGGRNYVELLFSAHPTTDLTKLINSIKTATSRRIRNAFKYDLQLQGADMQGLWEKSYYLTTEQTMCQWQDKKNKERHRELYE